MENMEKKGLISKNQSGNNQKSSLKDAMIRGIVALILFLSLIGAVLLVRLILLNTLDAQFWSATPSPQLYFSSSTTVQIIFFTVLGFGFCCIGIGIFYYQYLTRKYRQKYHT